MAVGEVQGDEQGLPTRADKELSYVIETNESFKKFKKGYIYFVVKDYTNEGRKFFTPGGGGLTYLAINLSSL